MNSIQTVKTELSMAGINLYKIKFPVTGIVIFFLLIINPVSCTARTVNETGNINDDQLVATYQHLEWFRDAKFGIFIHRGPYSRLAG